MQWVLTLGLSLSSAIDILIASSMCLYLQVSRTGFKRQAFFYDAASRPLFLTSERQYGPRHQYDYDLYAEHWGAYLVSPVSPV